MEIFLIKALQFMLAISLLVLLHEGGHFFFSKLFGVRVEKFYLFFDPWFSLFKFKPKKSDTTYGTFFSILSRSRSPGVFMVSCLPSRITYTSVALARPRYISAFASLNSPRLVPTSMS
jgi:hypothetical protein